MKRILFINSGFELGGIETFLVRAAEQLSENVKYSLLIMSDATNKDLLDKFSQYGDVYFLRDLLSFNIGQYAILRTILPLNRSKVKDLFSDIDTIHASCSFSLPLMRKISNILGDKVLESIGVYHSREFLWGNKERIMRRTQLSLFRQIPENNVIFMNDHTVGLYSKEFKIKYSCALPIGIDINIYSDCKPNQHSGRIVSIGRLVDFKTYNAHMIRCLSKLNHENKYKFEVYGDGPELKELRELADKNNVNVTFFGKLEYKKMPSVLNDASLFIGSGTAIVEAAAAGVPCIIGIESIEQPQSYGFLTDTVGLSFQEKGLNYPLYAYEKIMSGFSSLTENEYYELSARHRDRADVFSSSNMRLVLLEYYDNLSHSPKNINPSLMYLIGTLGWMILNKLKICNERKSMYDF